MEILPGVKIVDLGLYFKKDKILAMSDFHLGYEAALNARGVLMPRHQFVDIKNRLREILDKVRPKIIVITGDLRHEFGFVSQQEMNDIASITNFMKKYCERIVLVCGNHETIMGFVKKYVEVTDELLVGNNLFLHGDNIPGSAKNKNINTIIMGHEHPAVHLTDSITSEKTKIFIKGNWKGKNLIVLPSFNSLTEGTDVLRERLLSPFLQRSLDNFEVYSVPERGVVMHFKKIKNLK